MLEEQVRHFYFDKPEEEEDAQEPSDKENNGSGEE